MFTLIFSKGTFDIAWAEVKYVGLRSEELLDEENGGSDSDKDEDDNSRRPSVGGLSGSSKAKESAADMSKYKYWCTCG